MLCHYDVKRGGAPLPTGSDDGLDRTYYTNGISVSLHVELPKMPK